LISRSTQAIRCFAVLLIIILGTSGASCPRGVGPYNAAPAPVAFNAVPTWEQVTTYLNAQTQRVQNLRATSASLNIEGAPTLSTSLALERPQNLRLQAGLGLTGAELDLGSNQDEFWFWAKRNDPPGVYFARHADLAQLGSNGVLPVPPSWLIEAMGLVQIDPQSAHDGPRQLPDGRLEVRIQAATPQGLLLKVLTLDQQYGYVVEQTVYDMGGRVVARARAGRHQFDASAGVSLPQIVEIDLPSMPLKFSLETDGYVVNQLAPSGAALFSKPELPGYPPIHLSQVSVAYREPRVGWKSGTEFMRGR
jgi:hypothetical protein